MIWWEKDWKAMLFQNYFLRVIDSGADGFAIGRVVGLHHDIR